LTTTPWKNGPIWDLLEACISLSPPILIISRKSYQQELGGWSFEIGITGPSGPAIKRGNGEPL
jgi:hypothetical protein